MRSSPALPGCPSKGRPLLANAKHAGLYFRIRISFTLPQHGEVPERSNGEPLSLSGGDRGFESLFLQRGVACEPEDDIDIPVRRGSTITIRAGAGGFFEEQLNR